jgi:broad specificity phosphatase PhoE
VLKRIAASGICCVFLVLLFAPEAHSQVRTIFLIRHADKVSDAYDAPLSDRGLQRAKCLADTLADAHIDQIFISDLQRTQQTAAPLVSRLGLKPVVIPNTAPDNLVEAIRTSKSANVLVVWHGGTLPKVLQALGGPQVSTIAEPEYDRFYILTLAGEVRHPAPRFTALRYCDP